MSFLPRSRTQKYQNNDDGTQTIRCYGHHNPQYYMDSDGNYYDIDLSHTSSLNNENVGNYTLKSKNIHSLGIRQDDNKEKYIGIRPDETQDGSQQFEWTIISASVNGNNVPIDLSKNEFVDDNQTNLGNVTLFSTRRYSRQMLHYTGSINDFKIEYKIHLTGLKVGGSKYTSSTTLSNSNNVSVDTTYYKENDSNKFIILDDDNNIKYRITEPILLDSDFNEVQTSGSVHTLKDNGDGTYNYTKYPASSSINNITSSVNYIDATTVYAESDGYLGANLHFWSSAARSAANTGFTGVHSYTSNYLYAHHYKSTFLGQTYFNNIRTQMKFDTSGITNATNIVLYLNFVNWFDSTNRGIAIMHSSGSNFDAAGGNNPDYGYQTGWNRYRPYYGDQGSTNQEWNVAETVGYASGYQNVTLNSTAVSDINSVDDFQLVILDWETDFACLTGLGFTCGTVPDSQYNIEFYSTDYTSTSKDPYLSVTVPLPVVPYGIRLSSGKLTLNSGKVIIK